MSADEDVTEVAPQSAAQEVTARAAVPSLGNVHFEGYSVGPSTTNNRKYLFGGFNLTTDRPRVVLVQPRQGDNQDFNFPDQFAVQVITTSRTRILCAVRRIDSDAGWGQNLRLDLFVVD
jgi:hypothetical protein